MNCENINCDCGKLLAKVKNGKLYLYCKSCKKEIAFENEEMRKVFIRTTYCEKIENKEMEKLQKKFRAKEPRQ